jgi:hypothetical protein
VPLNKPQGSQNAAFRIEIRIALLAHDEPTWRINPESEESTS